ncbi:DUF1566 domain-containing protein [Stenotrophomonas sp. AB1(2024)]|uniref:Lcl C-terminal domain-containing protein n=1 Tax=Stenotrophomonas sp. AB1(2024) TaxID=3132215 RepID=UPI00309BC857
MTLELIKLDAEGNRLAAAAAEWVAVELPQHGLTFTASPVLDRDVPHAKCEAACKAVTMFGAEWDMPTLDELQLLVDRTRRHPAINTDYFRDIPSDWFWTSTAVAGSSASAWVVYFSYGGVLGNLRYSYGFALAVRRAGQ